MRINFRNLKLTREEKAIQAAMDRGEYVSTSQLEFRAISAAIKARRKNAVLNMRVSHMDLISVKRKAKKLGVPYQTLIYEFFRTFAESCERTS